MLFHSDLPQQPQLPSNHNKPEQGFVPVLYQHTSIRLSMALSTGTTARAQQTAVTHLITGLGWLCHLWPFSELLLPKIPVLSQTVRSLWPGVTGRREKIMVQDGESSAGVFCCRPDSSRDRQMRSIILQSPLPHNGLDSSSLLSKFFLLWGITALSPLEQWQCLQGDERAQGAQEPQCLTLAPETGPGQ